jgi:N-acetylmuramoyl-L-alanine amidase
MLRLSSVAGPAAAFISLSALAAITVPGKALGLDRVPELVSAVTATATVPDINPSASLPVPSSAIASATDVTPDEVHVATPTLTAGAAPAGLPTFASLAAAVDANDEPGAGDAELECLAGAVYFESKGEPLSGQLAVANVIINRTNSGRFPRSICGVVRQPGQFSFLRGGRMPEIRSGAQYQTALGVARVAMDKEWDNPAPDALYFHARRVSPGWGKARVTSIGNHIFYR